MKEKIYDLSFEEANKFLNFQFSDKTVFEKLEKSFYSVQKRLKIHNWANLVGNRFSWLFIRDLVQLNNKDACLSIINEIEHLENPDVMSSLTGEVKVFNRGLQGLHYKHYMEGGIRPLQKLYFQPLSRDQNFKKEIEKKFNARIKNNDQRPINVLLNLCKEEIIDHFFLRLGIETEATIKLKTRLDLEGKILKKITGEFFIFYPYKQEYYYLALWKHHNINEQNTSSYDEEQLKKAKQIKEYCEREFPEFSPNILSHL